MKSLIALTAAAPASARHYAQRVHGPLRLLPHHKVKYCEVKYVAHHRVKKCNYH